MSILSVTEIGRQASRSFNRYQRQYERQYQVLSSINNEDEDTVLSALPYSPGQYLSGVWVVKVEAHQAGPDESGAFFEWRASISFDSVLGDSTGGTGSAGASPSIGGNDPSTYDVTPINRLPVFSYSTEKLTHAVFQDVDGHALVNSAGMPFIPSIEEVHRIGIIKIEINKATLSNVGTYLDKLNDATVTWDGQTYTRSTLLVDTIDQTWVWEANVRYVKKTITVKYNPSNWRRRILDAGFYELAGATSSSGSGSGSGSGELNTACCGNGTGLRHITDCFGLPVSAPHLLDGAGHALPCDSTTPHYVGYWLNGEVSFGGLI